MILINLFIFIQFYYKYLIYWNMKYIAQISYTHIVMACYIIFLNFMSNGKNISPQIHNENNLLTMIKPVSFHFADII